MPCHQHRWPLAVATVVLSAIAYGMQDGASHWVPAQAVKEETVLGRVLALNLERTASARYSPERHPVCRRRRGCGACVMRIESVRLASHPRKPVGAGGDGDAGGG